VSAKAWWFPAAWVVFFGAASVAVAAVAAAPGPIPGLRPDPFAWLHALEWPAIRAIQSVEGLGRIMTWISDLGPGKPMFILIGLVYLMGDARLASRLAVLTLLSLGFRELLAMLLESPRPYWMGEGVRTFKDPPLATPTFGLPSGHAMASTTFWFFVAGEVRRQWVWAAAGAIVLAVCVSRVYLGVHFPSDVILGVVLGVMVLVGFRRWERPVEGYWRGLTRERRTSRAMGVGMGLAALTLAVWGWVSYAVPSDVWSPYGASARSCVGFGWTTGALAGMALAWVSPVDWTRAEAPLATNSVGEVRSVPPSNSGLADPRPHSCGSGDRRGIQRSWRFAMDFRRLTLVVVAAALFFFRPKVGSWNLAFPDGPEWVLLGARFVAGAVLAWAGLGLLPRAWVRMGFARRSEATASTVTQRLP